MQLITEESIKIIDSRLKIEDALSTKNVALKIDAAHAGVLNGNYLFYLPQALKYGSNSLNKFYKPLQKKHYSKTLGYIYNSEYLETKTDSEYFNKIVNSKNKKELISSVKKYMKTADYKNNPEGFGVLVAKAKLHDQQKISELQCNDIGTVSVAGDAGSAYCSICEGYIAECGHNLGHRYTNNELCFGIVTDDFEVDHISFETIPANWSTKSLIIQDSQLLGNIELIEEGQLMKLSLDELKEKLGNIESVLTEFNLGEFVEQYKADVQTALKIQFLLPTEQYLPFNTPLTTYVTNQLLSQLDTNEDKQILMDLFGTTYSDIFEGKTEDEVKEILTTGTAKEEVLVVEPEVVDLVAEPAVLSITDANQLVLAIADSLAVSFDNSFKNVLDELKNIFSKESEVKANKILEDQVKTYKDYLASADTQKDVITSELKESLINQIVLLTKIEKDSEYFLKLKDRSVQELKMTLEDHLQLSNTVVATPVVKTEVLEIKDSNNNITPVDLTIAAVAMEEVDPTVLEITDADKVVNDLVSSVDTKLTKTTFSTLYKKTVFEHGSKVAKKLHSALKAQNKI